MSEASSRLVVDLPHSDDAFVQAFPAETTEAFCEGHNAAFRYFGGVPRGIVYDNTTLAVAKILGDGTRHRTQSFSELESHYLFEARFGRPGKGNDTGKVEGLVGYARRNFFVPVPRVARWDALNADLARQCRARRGQRLRRHTETIGERFARDRAALLPLPPVPYDACDTRPTRVTSLSLVRSRRNDYSVPPAYGHRDVVVKGYVDVVVIVCGSEKIARHRRSYGREEVIFDPLHYVAVLERKTGALDHAAPLTGWALPDEFLRLRRRLETQLGKFARDSRLTGPEDRTMSDSYEFATHTSWLNQVELWFAKVKRDLLGRGIFTSVTDLARKLRRFITKYNERAKPVRWAYADPSRRIA